MVSYRLCQHWL